MLHISTLLMLLRVIRNMVSLHLLHTPRLGHLLLQKYGQNVTVNTFGSVIRTWSKAGSSHFPLWSKTLQGTVSTLEKERGRIRVQSAT